MQTSAFGSDAARDSFMARGMSASRVRDAYEEIVAILADVEKEKGIRPGLLKEIYDKEAGVVYLRSRERIHGDLTEMVSDAADGGPE